MSNAATSNGCSEDSTDSWSDVIPSQTGLMFTVGWRTADVDYEGSVTFSQAQLKLESPSCQIFSVPDSASQSLSLVASHHRASSPLTGLSNSNTTFIIRDIQRDHTWFSPSSPIAWADERHTQTSSTLGGKDVYARGSLLFRAHGTKRRRFSWMASDALDISWEFDPRTEFECAAEAWLQFWASEEHKAINEQALDDVTDEGYFSVKTSMHSTNPDRTEDVKFDEWCAVSRPTSYRPFVTSDPNISRRRLRKPRRSNQVRVADQAFVSEPLGPTTTGTQKQVSSLLGKLCPRRFKDGKLSSTESWVIVTGVKIGGERHV